VKKNFFHVKNRLLKTILNERNLTMDIIVSKYWQLLESKLFAEPEIILGTTTEFHKRLMLSIDVIDFASLFPYHSISDAGRPKIPRETFVKAFIAKSIFRLETNVSLIERLQADLTLRRICGFTKNKIPCEATFSNVFAEFAEAEIAEKIHEKIIKDAYEDKFVFNISRDSTAIEARESVDPAVKKAKRVKKEALVKAQAEVEVQQLQEKKVIRLFEDNLTQTLNVEQKLEILAEKRRRGRPRKEGVESPKKSTILGQQQAASSLEEMSQLVSQSCDYGCKKNAKGFVESWKGYKVHFDTADGGVPISCVISSASVHDSSVSLILEEITGRRVESCYTLADSAYDCAEIKMDIEKRGKVAVIDSNPRRSREKQEFDPPKKERYKERTTAERLNAQLKDNFLGRNIFVRGAKKIMSHIMFGVVCITTTRLYNLDHAT
jgi:hypothetical protein